MILVTGASGFVARHLIPKLLERGDTVVGIDVANFGNLKGVIERKLDAGWDFWLHELDVTNEWQFARLEEHKQFDCVIHLAAMAAPRLAEKDPAAAFKLNVLGTHNVLKYALKAGAKKFVFASTAHVYGISPRYMPTDERHPLALQDHYTTTKILGEQLCQLFYENHGLSYTTLRMFNGYGPGQSEDYFIPAMIRKAQRGRIELSGRKVTKDFVYVDDMVAALVLAVATDFVGPINIGSGVQTSLEDVARYIASKFNAELGFGPEYDPGPTQMQCDRGRAKRVLGWEPTVGLNEGLDRTVATFPPRG